MSPFNETPETTAPLPGEVILLACDIRRLGFHWGPGSAVTIDTPAPGDAASVVSLPNVAPRVLRIDGARKTWHYFLCSQVARDGSAVLHLIFSYSRPPRGHPVGQPWDAAQWMRTAHEAQRIHHIPIPAMVNGVLWDGLPNPHEEAPAMSFGEWRNTIPAWIALSPVRVPFRPQNLPQWRRFRTGPVVLDNPAITTLQLTNFCLLTIPEYLRAHGYALAPSNSLGVHTVFIPTYTETWTNIFSDAAVAFHEEIAEAKADVEGDQSASDSDDPVRITDPMWIWNLFPLHPGAPEWAQDDAAADRQEAVQHKREENTKLVETWDDGYAGSDCVGPVSDDDRDLGITGSTEDVSGLYTVPGLPDDAGPRHTLELRPGDAAVP